VKKDLSMDSISYDGQGGIVMVRRCLFTSWLAIWLVE